MEKLNIEIFILLTLVGFSNQWIIFDNISTKADFYRAVKQIDDKENRIKIGGNLRLNQKESYVNDVLMKFKRREIDEAYSTGKLFPPSSHFFKAKQFIDQSKVLQIIRLMPKDCPWKLLTAERSKVSNVAAFDAILSLLVDNPEKVYPTQAAAWEVLGLIFENIINIFSLRSVFEDYFYEGLRQFYADNIQYVEIRSTLSEVLDSNGKKINQHQVVQLLKDVTDRFARDHPGFFGTKLIFTGLRSADNNKILQDVRKSVEFLKSYPDFFAGYDMIINEDGSPPISDVVEALLYPRNLNPSVYLPYFLHAGETNWQDLTADKNVLSAIVVNSTRLGHGFTVMKHPIVKNVMRALGKAVEMNPISHQALALVSDQRDHPASYMIAEGFPLVIGNDASNLWDALPMSHDYYITFMAHSGRDGDIRVLKQLYLNSIQYSSLNDEEKRRLKALWQRRWDQFLDEVIRLYGKPKRRY
ncbi:hypothetical protein KUTeg_023595 [Tegillarca granosa]|uniref:adenosine deaminase n=1 Tax=Tegillarca granosa TaxID=220873 RepID=A0ABQ9E7P5_TEGGR|nr:hypothetical protein KUTeg_023595 [Tegillarca granosa]